MRLYSKHWASKATRNTSTSHTKLGSVKLWRYHMNYSCYTSCRHGPQLTTLRRLNVSLTVSCGSWLKTWDTTAHTHWLMTLTDSILYSIFYAKCSTLQCNSCDLMLWSILCICDIIPTTISVNMQLITLLSYTSYGTLIWTF